MAVYIQDKWDIEEIVNEEMGKIYSAQRRIGMLLHKYKDDKELLESINENYGTRAYIEMCIGYYEGSLMVDI